MSYSEYAVWSGRIEADMRLVILVILLLLVSLMVMWAFYRRQRSQTGKRTDLVKPSVAKCSLRARAPSRS